jgi:DNA ligase 1
MTWRPMLACSAPDDLEGFHVPLTEFYVSPKIDGIRCTVLSGIGGVSRSGKAFPNKRLRELLSDPKLVGLDGELVIGDVTSPTAFNTTTRAVMAFDGDLTGLTFTVFDSVNHPAASYDVRWQEALWALRYVPDWVRPVENEPLLSLAHLTGREYGWTRDGYEGVMLRRRSSQYKAGRSTLREAGLMKVKRFADAEGVVVGYHPLEVNTNEPYYNEVGLQVRSTCKGGKVSTQLLGALILSAEGWSSPFCVGTGFTEFDRAEIWSARATYLGRCVKFKYQKHGSIDAPRTPVFLGFRDERDL